MFRKLTVCVSAITLAVVSGLASAVTLQDVSFSSLPGNRTEVTLKFDGQPPEPTGYTIERPARIAVDLRDTQSGLASRNISLGSGNTQSMTVVETKDRTRLIFNLVELTPYTTSRDQNSLVLTIGGESGVASGGGMTQAGSQSMASSGSAASASTQSDGLQGIDFRRGENGEGKVIVSLPSAKTPVDLTENGGRIKLVMDNTDVPEDLRRRLDVTDFATPVTRVDTYMEGDNAVVEIRPEGNYDYIAYQADNEFTVSVEPLTQKEAESRQESKFPYSGDKLSLNFQDIEVRSVLQLIADFTGLNLVASDTVSGSITLRLQNVPWDQALDLILKT